MKDKQPARVERLGRYELLGTLGSGGMGDVHRARAYGAAGTVKDLCVKRIRASRLSEAGAVERFVSEARLSMRLSHGNIVPVFDFGRADGQYFLAMEWVDGADARALLRSGPLSPAVAAHVAAEVARALHYAHSLPADQGGPLIHRDVKPGNVLVSVSGDVKLVDFGVAITSCSASTGCAGTLAYMAPEQERGDLVDAKADLFSLGVVLAELLGLGRPRTPSAVSPQCCDALLELLHELLAEAPAQRPENAKVVASRLEAFVAQARLDGEQAPRDALSSRVRARKATVKQNRDTQILATDLSFLRDGDDLTVNSMLDATGSTVGEEGAVFSPSAREPRLADADAATQGSASAWTRRRRSAWIGLTIALLVGSAALRFGWVQAEGSAPSDAQPTSESARADSTQASAMTTTNATPATDPLNFTPAADERMPAALSVEPTFTTPAGELQRTTDATPTGPAKVRAQPPRHSKTTPGAAPGVPVDTPRSPQDTAAELAPEPEAALEPAHVDINATPWAHVSVDGRDLGTTPLFGVALEAGTHRVRLTNEPLGQERQLRLDLAPGSHRRVVVDLLEGD